MSDFKYEITREIGIISENSKGWRRELNMVSWNDREPKFDIRDWSPGREKMGRGITFDRDEAVVLLELLKECI